MRIQERIPQAKHNLDFALIYKKSESLRVWNGTGSELSEAPLTLDLDKARLPKPRDEALVTEAEVC